MLRAVPLVALLAGVAAGACSGAPDDRAAPPPASADASRSLPAAGAPVETTAADGDPAADPAAAIVVPVKPVPANLPAVVARVNGQEISRVEFEETVQGIEGSVGAPVPPEERDRVYREVLDDMIGLRLLIQEALRRVTVSDAEVEAQVQQIRRQFPSEDRFQQALQQDGTTIAALRANLGVELAVAKLLEEAIGDRVQPSAADVSAYYRENQEQFRQVRVRASHILFAVPPYADAAARLRVRQQAEAVAAQIRGGRDFAAIAREQSQDPGTAARGGDLGYFAWGDMMEPLNQVAFRLQPNVDIEVVDSARGAHIVKVTERQPASQIAPLEEVREQIGEILTLVNEQRETEAFVDTLREQGRVQIYF